MDTRNAPPRPVDNAEPQIALSRPPATADPALLLAWYDRQRRDLPWRAAPGEAPDPYGVWLSEVMLQQTTVRAVIPYFLRFRSLWPDVFALASAPLEEVLKVWAGLGYYARARNLHACAQTVVARHAGRFPADEAVLRDLPGIGAYTAAAIAAIAFGKRATPVDGNIERVVARLHAVETPLPEGKPEIATHARRLTPADRPGDFAQALMDLGATICTPRSPACAVCPWTQACEARLRADPESFPRKRPRREGERRRGAAFVAVRSDGAVLVCTRPAKGLLGGMTEVPGTGWTRDFDPASALADAPDLRPPGRARAARPDWRRVPGTVLHVFTHFPLELAVFRVEVPAGTEAPEGMRWLSPAEMGQAAFPTVMRKVLAAALDEAPGHGPRPRIREQKQGTPTRARMKR